MLSSATFHFPFSFPSEYEIFLSILQKTLKISTDLELLAKGCSTLKPFIFLQKKLD